MNVAPSLEHDAGHVFAALLLNWIAGFVDLIGWVLFLGLYTANMTGNLVSIGRLATQGGSLFLHLLPVAGFFIGLFCAALWTQADRTWWHPLAAEAALLAGLGVARSPLPIWAAAIAAFAMGLQNATLKRSGRLSVRTTHVTGTISRLAESLAQWLRTRRRQPGERVLFLAGLLVTYLAGAVCGTLTLVPLGQRALLIPAAALVAWLLLHHRARKRSRISADSLGN